MFSYTRRLFLPLSIPPSLCPFSSLLILFTYFLAFCFSSFSGFLSFSNFISCNLINLVVPWNSLILFLLCRSLFFLFLSSISSAVSSFLGFSPCFFFPLLLFSWGCRSEHALNVHCKNNLSLFLPFINTNCYCWDTQPVVASTHSMLL